MLSVSDLTDRAREVIAQREAVPGQPSEGPYPASVEEVADELAGFVDELDATCAPGVLVAVAVRLAKSSGKPRAGKGVVTMGEPPRVRASCTVAPETWTRLPDDGFEILHSHTGNQAIGAHPVMVEIRRLGPEIDAAAPAGGVSTVDYGGRSTPPIPYNATEEQRRAAERELEPAAPKFRPEESAEQQCSYCEATDRVLAMARLLDEFAFARVSDDADVWAKLFDALVKVAEIVSKRDPLGRKLTMTILGVKQ